MDQLALSAMLADITAVRQRSELLRQYKGYGFNLLQVLVADTDEVKMCRLLPEAVLSRGAREVVFGSRNCCIARVSRVFNQRPAAD